MYADSFRGSHAIRDVVSRSMRAKYPSATLLRNDGFRLSIRVTRSSSRATCRPFEVTPSRANSSSAGVGFRRRIMSAQEAVPRPSYVESGMAARSDDTMDRMPEVTTTVAKVSRETPDAVTLRLDLAGATFLYRPGQYIEIDPHQFPE